MKFLFVAVVVALAALVAAEEKCKQPVCPDKFPCMFGNKLDESGCPTCVCELNPDQGQCMDCDAMTMCYKSELISYEGCYLCACA